MESSRKRMLVALYLVRKMEELGIGRPSTYAPTISTIQQREYYKESDKLLTVLTAEGGKRTVKARGCRRKGSPLAAAAQLLVYSDMTLFEYRDYFTLNEAESLQQFWRVRSDLERLSCIYRCLFIWKERAFPEWLAGCRNNLQKRSGMHMPLLST